MKTVILQVEAYDNVASIRDKIIGSRAERILLVIPRQKRAFPNRVELTLLSRLAQENGAAFALVSRSDITREYAESLGITVFGSIPEAQKGEWQLVDEPVNLAARFRGKEGVLRMREDLPMAATTRSPHPIIRLSMISMSILAIFALLIFLIPSATIVVYPEPETQSVTVDIRASTAISHSSVTGLLPAMEEPLSVSGQKTLTSTGSITIGTEKARGEVTVRNLTTEAQEIPEGASFVTGGEQKLRYIVVASVNLPAESKGVIVPVEALLPGIEGNIGPGMITLLEGSSGLKVEVTNEAPITGGASKSVNSPTEGDYLLAHRLLLSELEEKALKAIENGSSQEKTPVPGSLKLFRVESEERENPVGEPSDTVTLNMTAAYKVLVYDTIELITLVEDVLNLSIPEGYHDAETPTSIINQEEVTIDAEGEASWQVTASRQVLKDIEKQPLIMMLRGMEKSEAIKRLNEEITNVKEAEVQTFLKWWPWLPFFTGRINLVEGVSG